MMASPQTFNMMSDVRTAAEMQMAGGGQVDSNFSNSVMRNLMSPNGKSNFQN